jgi:hypothetical protein
VPIAGIGLGTSNSAAAILRGCGACVIASFPPGEPFGFLLQKIKRDADTKL